MAEIVIGTFAEEAELKVDTDYRSQVTLAVRIKLDRQDHEKIRQLVEALNDWLERP